MEVKQILQILWRWRWPMVAVVGTTMLALVLASIFAEPEYQGKVKLQVTTPEQENVALFDEPRYASEREAVIIARNNFQVILESNQVRNDTIEELGLAEADQDYKLDVVPIRDADFLDIVITAHTSELAAYIANTHTQAAIVRMGELSALRSNKVKNHLAKQLEKAREEMSQAESELSAFQSEYGIVDLSSALANSQYLLQQLQLERNRILSEEADSQTDSVAPIELLIKQRRDELEPLLETRSKQNELVSNVTVADESFQEAYETFQNANETYQTELEQNLYVNIEDRPQSFLEADTAIKDAGSALQDAETTLQDAESALKEFLRKNDMVTLESEIGMLQKQIEQLSLERDQQMLVAKNQEVRQIAKINSLQDLIAEREAEIDSLRALDPQFNFLRMNVDQARARYDMVAGKYSEADLKTKSLQNADFLQLVSAAEPPESAASDVKKLIVLGLAGGFGLAVLLAFLLEYLQGFKAEYASTSPTFVSESQSKSEPIASDGEYEGKPAV